MPPAIRVDSLSKLYRVGARQQGYKTLRESVTEACAAPLRRLREIFNRRSFSGVEVAQGASRLSGENFWALKDVNFEVQPGEVVGIIGRNGAGKSTLLKILSRITEPTSGRIELRGRVGSLLEVGTGFHPELTGRENVYMNGSILGMSRREIERKFDAIVNFAGVDGFLDTPVKRYSSGMYVRLAFAVAAHLEPEVLIVDEVLAVGDASFQEKCLGKMRDIAGSGRTVLFVSHNTASLASLCTHGVYLRDGRVVCYSDMASALRSYLADSQADRAVFERGAVSADGRPAIRGGYLASSGLRGVTEVSVYSDIAFHFAVAALPKGAWCTFTIYNSLGVAACAFSSARVDACFAGRECEFHCEISPLQLAEGEYYVNVALLAADGRLLDRVERAICFRVMDEARAGRGRTLPVMYLQPHSWSVE